MTDGHLDTGSCTEKMTDFNMVFLKNGLPEYKHPYKFILCQIE